MTLIYGEYPYLRTTSSVSNIFSPNHSQFRIPIYLEYKKIGIATGDYGLILRTSDGGITWKREANSIDGSNDFNAVVVFSEQESTVGGAHGMLLNREAIFLPTVVTSGTGLDFGTVTSGSKELSLTISAANEAGVIINMLQIQDGSGGPKGFTLVAPATAAPYNLTPSTPLTVTVRYTPKNGATGNIVSTLHLTTNDAARQQINLPLRAKGSSQAAAATVSATQLEFGEVAPGTISQRTVSITASGGAPLQVAGIRVESLTGQEGFTAAAERQLPTSLVPGDSLRITVKFTPEDFEAPTQAMLSVETNAADAPHTVFLQGQGTQPVASVSSSSLDFGTVDQGNEQTRSFSIAAGNGAGVRVDTLYFQSDGGGTAAEFSIVEPTVGFPIHIQKGDPLDITVRFRPGTRNGAIAAALFAKTNLSSPSLLKISLAAVANLSTSSVQEFPMATSISIATWPTPLANAGGVRLVIPTAGNVRVVIYDMLGKPVGELFNGMMEAGPTELPIDAAGLANGRYFCIAEGEGMRGFVELQIER
ncbi:MAG: choice-of-anchor D domain-containing protein [Armatimonadetes bacterium]|nr:choice-of-anchor D domain-containing protein [Armatimonadota bacterium]